MDADERSDMAVSVHRKLKEFVQDELSDEEKSHVTKIELRGDRTVIKIVDDDGTSTHEYPHPLPVEKRTYKIKE